MAARGNRSRGGVCVGVALFATLAAALGFTQPALAQEAPPPPPPAESTSTTTDPTTAAPAPADSPPADTNATEPSPDATPPDPGPTITEPPAQSSSTEPPAEQPAEASVTETTTTTPAETKPAAASTTDSADAANAVKLEAGAPAATTAPAAPAAQAAPAPAATPTSAALSGAAIVLVATQPAAVAAENSATAIAAAAQAGSAAEDAEAVAQDDAVRLRPRSVAAVRFDAAPALRPAERSAAVPVAVPLNSRIAREACIRPHGLVPLSQKCRVVVRTPLAHATLAYAIVPSPEVRAAIDRGAARAAAGRARAAPPPESKAAKERPIPKIRPILPFGGVALGALQDGFGGVAGSASSSRIFALATVPVRVPRPFTLARLRLPSTIAHGALAASPPTRPG